MLLFLTLFSVTYLLSSIHLEIVVLLWFLASCLLLSSPRISEGFLVVNWGGPVFPHHLPKLWVPRPEKLFRPDALLLTMLSPIAWFCWACTALPGRKWGDAQERSQFPDLLPPFPRAWNSKDSKQHLQRLVGPGGSMPWWLTLCGLNIEPWPLLWGVFLLFGTMSVYCPTQMGFFVHAFCWPIYWEAKGEFQLNVKKKVESGSAETENKPKKQGESGE